MATVRVAGDVNDRLKALASAPGEERSVTQIVDAVLRRHVGLVADTSSSTPVDSADLTPSLPRARASVGRPRARAGRGRDSSQAGAKCQHPVGRRIGNQCAACGATV